ncbi:MAG: ATP-dependent RNA helicase tdrd9, partial [Paramarteilia canceri]
SSNDKLVDPDLIDQYYERDFQYPPLPIVKHKDKIIETLHNHNTIIISGRTGCGKSVLVPQFIVDDCHKNHKPCRILITQPRRIAAKSLANHVSKIRGWTLGQIVGYKVSLEKACSNDSAIVYITTGVLLNILSSERSLEKYSHIIIDEVHERNLDVDFALLILRKLIRVQSSSTKVIIMSATMNAKMFADYFSYYDGDVLTNPPIIDIKSSTYNVTEIYENQHDFISKFSTEDTLSVEDQISQQKFENALRIIQNLDKKEKEMF